MMTEQHPTYQPPQPFRASFEGFTNNPGSLDEWPNTVAVEAVEGYDSTFTGVVDDAELEYADFGEVRQLVEIDTNYKSTRAGEHPVRLTRTDAVQFSAAVLEAIEDTFHATRCGRLRPVEAKELLEAVRDLEYQLQELREHALTDLVIGAGLERDPLTVAAERASAVPPGQDCVDGNEVPLVDEPGAVEEEAGSVSPAEDNEPDGEPSLTLEQQFADALGALFPACLHEVAMSDAYGALKYKVIRRCEETGESPRQVLGSVSARDRAFVPNANDPAAFLASRIES